MIDPLTLICGDALEQLKQLPAESVQSCVTSPPYWGLRDYGTAAWEDEARDKGITGTDGRNGRLRVGLDRKSAEDKNPGYKTIGWQPTCRCEWDSGGPLPQGNNLVPATVLDPFAGSGTTGAVALELGRKAVLIELNPAYIELIEQRCSITPGLPLA